MIFGSLTSEQAMCHLIDAEFCVLFACFGTQFSSSNFFFSQTKGLFVYDSAQGRSGMRRGYERRDGRVDHSGLVGHEIKVTKTC